MSKPKTADLLELLEDKRRKLKQTKKVFASSIGTDSGTYCHALAGRSNLPARTVRKIAKLLGRPAAEVEMLRYLVSPVATVRDRLLTTSDLEFMTSVTSKLHKPLPLSLLLEHLELERPEK